MNLNQQPEEQGEANPSHILGELNGGSAADEGEMPSGMDFSTAKARRRVSLTNVVVAIVLVISAGSLYLMRKQGKGAGMTFQVSQIDYELDKAGETDADQQRLLAELARTGGSLAVQVDPIQKNPFQLENDTDAPASVYDTDLDRRRRADQRAQEISSSLAGLKLNGILGGSVPLARIGGETVSVGDRVAGMFIVEAIHPDLRSVELKVDGEVYTLTMTDGAQPRRSGRAGNR